MIPESITIDGFIIPIKMVKNLYRDYSRYGEYSSMETIINLDDDMSDQKKELILCHEIMEAIEDIYLMSLEENEKQVMARCMVSNN